MIQKAFPKVKVITGAIDDDLSEHWLTVHGDALEGAMGRKLWVIEPGMGSISGSCILCRISLTLTSHEPMCEQVAAISDVSFRSFSFSFFFGHPTYLDLDIHTGRLFHQSSPFLPFLFAALHYRLGGQARIVA